MFSEDVKLSSVIEHKRLNGNNVMAQLKSHVFNKPELSKATKLMIHRSLFRSTIMYGNDGGVDTN